MHHGLDCSEGERNFVLGKIQLKDSRFVEIVEILDEEIGLCIQEDMIKNYFFYESSIFLI